MTTFRSRRRWRIFFALIAVYALIGFFVLPPIAKRQLEERLSAEWERHVSVGRVRINPFALSVAVEQLEVATPDGAGSLFGWERVYVNFDALASIGRDWVCSEVALQGFHAFVEVKRDGASNFSYLLEKYTRPEAGAAAASPGRAWRFGRIDVAAARVELIDRSRAESFATVVGPIDFTLLDFHTAGGRGAPYRFAARTESGEKLDWSGTLRASPLASSGEWRIEQLRLPKYAPYFQDRLTAILTDGRMTADGRYELDLSPASRRLLLKDGHVVIEKLRLIDRTAGQPVLDLAGLEVTGVAADAFAAKYAAEAVHLSGGRVNVRRDRDGALNFPAAGNLGASARMAGSGAAPTPPAKKSAVPPPPSVTVREISLRDFELAWRDETPPRPAQFALTRLNAAVKNFSLTPGATMAVSMAASCPPQGTVNVVGEFALEPAHAAVDLELAWLSLAPLSPYLEKTADAGVKRGTVALKGHLAVAAGGSGAPAVTFAGDGRVEDFALVARTNGEELAGFADLVANAIEFAGQPRASVAVRELKLDGPFARVSVAEDGTLNLAGWLRSRPAATPAMVTFSPSAARATAAMDVSLARLAIAGGEFSFSDRSTRPAAQLALKEVGGLVSDLSSEDPGRGEAELHAKVNGAGAITITGRLNPLAANPAADLKVKFDAVELAPAAPYVGKYAGYELERGMLFLDADARLGEQKLDLSNHVTLDQFTLGRATNSPDAVKLPVRLGVALLKDAQGRIVLDLPIQGRLDDPQFEVGPVVGRVFTNLLAKAAASPFTLLGSMFGGGGEELGEQDFAPGETTLTAESLRRLATVRRALEARPALRLEIAGGYDPAADGAALRQAKLDALVRQRVGEERRARGAEAVAPSDLLISNEERAATIERLFDEQFSAAETEAMAESAPPPVPEVKAAEHKAHRGFFRRTVDVVTFKGVRERRALRKERARTAELAREQTQPEKTIEVASPNPSATAAQPPLAEMAQRLAATLAATPGELAALAEARAERVRGEIIAQGKIAPERVGVAKAGGADAEKIGARARLRLE